MPAPTKNSLLCILLCWTTIISILQAAFIILLFTQGHIGQLQNGSVTESMPLKHSRIHSTTSPPPANMLHSDTGEMISFKVVGQEKGALKWRAVKPEDFISGNEAILTIMNGGHYFLNLQVTLTSDDQNSKCEIRLSQKNEVIMEGRVNTGSPLLRNKAQILPTGAKLEVTIRPDVCRVNETLSVTHLDIIYLPLRDS
ncbi:unnamed protein product [Ophioblennius macclurei]